MTLKATHLFALYAVFLGLKVWGADPCATSACTYFPEHFFISVASPDPATVLVLGVVRGGGNLNFIKRSTDGGQTWSDAALPPVEGLRDLQFANSMVGYAVGDGGLMFRTQDGGILWTSVPSGVKDDLVKVDFHNASAGFVLGRNIQGSTLLKTFDAGMNWKADTIRIAQFASIDFIDDSIAFAVENYGVFQTRDGGTVWDTVRSWSPLPGYALPRKLFDIRFMNANMGVILGAGPMIVPTWSGGFNWGPTYVGPDTYYGMRAAAWQSPDILVAVGDNGEIQMKTSVGFEWNKIWLTEASLVDIVSLSPGRLLAVGNEAIVRIDLASLAIRKSFNSRTRNGHSPILIGRHGISVQTYGYQLDLQGRHGIRKMAAPGNRSLR